MAEKKSRTGFTLVELMVVILIVGILAAIAIPIYRGQIDKAKWSEGKAMMGTIATAIRAWSAEKSSDYSGPFPSSLSELGFTAGDCTGTYFSDADFTSISVTQIDPLLFTITCEPTSQSDGPASPASMSLVQNGDGTTIWVEGS